MPPPVLMMRSSQRLIVRDTKWERTVLVHACKNKSSMIESTLGSWTPLHTQAPRQSRFASPCCPVAGTSHLHQKHVERQNGAPGALGPRQERVGGGGRQRLGHQEPDRGLKPQLRWANGGTQSHRCCAFAPVRTALPSALRSDTHESWN